jgi:hypothetical protein
MIKMLNKLCIERMYFNTRVIYNKPKDNIISNGEKSERFFVRSGRRQ